MTDTWTWATVTQASPLRIKVDGDTSALNATTDNLVGSLAVDDRVRVHLHADGIIVTGIQGGGNRSNPNLLINSDFMVNQEGTASGATIPLNGYVMDGWKNYYGTRTAYTWADVGGVRTFSITGQGGGTLMRQTMEASDLPAGVYTLSCSNAVNLEASGGTTIDSGPGWKTFSTDGATDILAGLSVADGVTVALNWMKLERGTVATPYQPPTYADNLRACMRHYQRLGGVDAYEPFAPCFGLTTTATQPVVFLPVPLRAVPTITWGGALRLQNSSPSLTVTGLTLDRAGRSAIRLTVTAASVTVDKPYELRASNDITAYIAFDARL